MLEFEHRNQPLASKKKFLKRTFRYLFYACAMVLFSVVIGTLGYHYYGQLSWIDSFYNACMILAGVGPIASMPNSTAKLFSAFYALFIATAFFSVIAVVMAPLVHRLLHIINRKNQG